MGTIQRGFYTFLFCFSVLSLTAYAQGKVMLVGGGSEVESGWSDLPYTWAVENSSNKKIAIISYSEEDNFIPNYFVSLGATGADNLKIESREVADLQSTYDALMQYDVFFFKGGDQSMYYKLYKNTRTFQAIVDKFNTGGVIAGTSAGMAILSGVIFTAENGSVYPDEVLQDFNSNKIRLKDDFLSIFPGYIFDSHFTERGRGARLLGFMTNWFIDNGALLTGIGVDDRTALCIDSNKNGVVFGTGSVSVYTGSIFTAYQEDKPLTDSVHVVQLLHGHRIGLEPLNILDGPDGYVAPSPLSEQGNYEVILSGSEGLSTNTDFIDYLVQDAGESNDTIVLVTAPGRAASYRQKLTDLAVTYVVVETSSPANEASQIDLRNTIRRSKKILFAENEDELLFDFLKEGPTGALLEGHIRRNNMTSAFVGEDSRYAGKVFVTNHLSDKYAAYYGRLNYNPGLALLRTSIIMSNTYDINETDFYENTTAAVSYATIVDSLKYGIYLNRNSYMRFYQEADHNYFQANGNLSTVVMINNGTDAALAAQRVNNAGDVRNYVAYSGMQYALLNGSARIYAGNAIAGIYDPYEFEAHVVGVEDKPDPLTMHVFPNPSASGVFNFSVYPPEAVTFSVSDFLGRKLLNQVPMYNDRRIDLSSYPDGMYVVTLDSAGVKRTIKIIKGLAARE
jgi:cyanophycinase